MAKYCFIVETGTPGGYTSTQPLFADGEDEVEARREIIHDTLKTGGFVKSIRPYKDDEREMAHA